MKKCLELKQNVIIHVILSNSSLFACTTTQTWGLYKGLLIKRCTLACIIPVFLSKISVHQCYQPKIPSNHKDC